MFSGIMRSSPVSGSIGVYARGLNASGVQRLCALCTNVRVKN